MGITRLLDLSKKYPGTVRILNRITRGESPDLVFLYNQIMNPDTTKVMVWVKLSKRDRWVLGDALKESFYHEREVQELIALYNSEVKKCK